MKTASCVAIGTLCLLCLANQSQAIDRYQPAVGKPHADFILPRIDTREAVSLAQFRGRKVLLIQFASW